MSHPVTSLEEVREIMFEILHVLHNHGIDTVSVGGIMRLLGVSSEVAAQHDDEFLQVSVEAFVDDTESSEQVPPGTTLH